MQPRDFPRGDVRDCHCALHDDHDVGAPTSDCHDVHVSLNARGYRVSHDFRDVRDAHGVHDARLHATCHVLLV